MLARLSVLAASFFLHATLIGALYLYGRSESAGPSLSLSRGSSVAVSIVPSVEIEHRPPEASLSQPVTELETFETVTEFRPDTAEPERSILEILVETPRAEAPDFSHPTLRTFERMVSDMSSLPAGAQADAAVVEGLYTPGPDYPRIARRRALEGVTVVEFQILPQGEVAAARIVETSGYDFFDTSAIDAVTLWKYKPTGVSAPVAKRVRFVFRFTGEQD